MSAIFRTASNAAKAAATYSPARRNSRCRRCANSFSFRSSPLAGGPIGEKSPGISSRSVYSGICGSGVLHSSARFLAFISWAVLSRKVDFTAYAKVTTVRPRHPFARRGPSEVSWAGLYVSGLSRVEAAISCSFFLDSPAPDLSLHVLRLLVYKCSGILLNHVFRRALHGIGHPR